MSEARRRKLAAIAAASAMAIGLVSAGTLAAYTDTEVIEDNQFTAGHLDLSVGPQTTAITASGMAPGDRVTEAVTVANEGTVPLSYSIKAEQTPDSGTLGQVLDVSVHGGVASPEELNAATAALSAQGFPTLDTVALSDEERHLAPGEAETLYLDVAMQRGSTTQHMTDSATFEFTFDAVQSVVSEDIPVPVAAMGAADADTVTFSWEDTLGTGGAYPANFIGPAMEAADGEFYEYRYQVDGGTPVTQITRENGAEVEAAPGSEVSLQVRTAEGAQRSHWSDRMTATTAGVATDQSLPAPTITGITRSLEDVTVGWAAGEGTAAEATYEYRYRYAGGSWSDPVATSSTTETFSGPEVSWVEVQVRVALGEQRGPWSGSHTKLAYNYEQTTPTLISKKHTRSGGGLSTVHSYSGSWSEVPHAVGYDVRSNWHRYGGVWNRTSDTSFFRHYGSSSRYYLYVEVRPVFVIDGQTYYGGTLSFSV